MSSFLSLAIFSAIHLTTPAFRFLSHLPRKAWLSFGGGTSIAYITLDLLPRVEQALVGLNHYLFITAGIVAFYGLEIYAQRHANEGQRKKINKTHRAIHAATFITYSFMIGYLASTLVASRELILFTIAMAIHFTVVDYDLWGHYPKLYRRWGRWASVIALWVGFSFDGITKLPALYPNIFFAFVAGGILLNTLKEELPEEKQGRFGYFVLGVITYAIVILIL